MAFEAFVDGVKVGEAEDHTHGSGSAKTLTITASSPSSQTTNTTVTAADARRAGAAPAAKNTLVLLAEELGYANYGFLHELMKGLSAPPSVDGSAVRGSWKMRGGLAGEHLGLFTAGK
jgi:hypothetical protein